MEPRTWEQGGDRLPWAIAIVAGAAALIAAIWIFWPQPPASAPVPSGSRLSPAPAGWSRHAR